MAGLGILACTSRPLRLQLSFTAAFSTCMAPAHLFDVLNWGQANGGGPQQWAALNAQLGHRKTRHTKAVLLPFLVGGGANSLSENFFGLFWKSPFDSSVNLTRSDSCKAKCERRRSSLKPPVGSENTDSASRRPVLLTLPKNRAAHRRAMPVAEGRRQW